MGFYNLGPCARKSELQRGEAVLEADGCRLICRSVFFISSVLRLTMTSKGTPFVQAGSDIGAAECVLRR